jgi:uncharacterized coiled-coil protein SlyX
MTSYVSEKGGIMIDRDSYLEDKQARIDIWISQLARLDGLCREAGDDVRVQFEVQLAEFRQNLKELNDMIREFQKLNDYGREKFREVVDKNWNKLEESFERSFSEYEHLIRAKTSE